MKLNFLLFFAIKFVIFICTCVAYINIAYIFMHVGAALCRHSGDYMKKLALVGFMLLQNMNQ